MGYFDRVSAIRIKKDDEGRDVYFHWGVIGEGRIVPSAQEDAWLRRNLKRRHATALLGFGLFLLVLLIPLGDDKWGYPIVIGALFVFCGIPDIVLSSRITSRTATWPLSNDRLTMDESTLATVRAMGRYGFTIGIGLAALVSVVGCTLIVPGRNIFLGIVFIGLGLWGFFRLWRAWLLARRIQ